MKLNTSFEKKLIETFLTTTIGLIKNGYYIPEKLNVFSGRNQHLCQLNM